MSRRAAAPSRTILPDPKFHSDMLAKFMNVVMHSGKKSAAEHILYGAIERITEKTGRQANEALELLSQALDNVKPVVEVKSRRVGGANYQVPVEVNADRRTSLAIRWLVTYSRGRAEKGMIDKLSNELLDASNGKGAAIKKKEDVHRMAEANKAFAHYRW